MRCPLILLVSLVAALALVVGVVSPARAAGIDPTYGEGGIVDLTGPVPPGSAVSMSGVSSFGPAADGSAYVLGSRGVGVPINGVRIGLAALDGGRVLVTDNGNHFCRYACSSTPTMVRFLE